LKDIWDKVTKRDMVYIFLLLAEFTCAILLKGQLSSSEVVNVISIGAGLTSIFLAVVAILYSFSQSSESARQNESLNNALNGINLRVLELDNVKNELVSIKDEIINIKKDTKHISEQFKFKGEITKEEHSLEQNFYGDSITTDEYSSNYDANHIQKLKIRLKITSDMSISDFEKIIIQSIKDYFNPAVVYMVSYNSKNKKKDSFEDVEIHLQNYVGLPLNSNQINIKGPCEIISVDYMEE
jgi:hypothetical protein